MDTEDTNNKSIDSIHFGQLLIGVNEPVFIIAEIGINHEGDVNICALMIEEAAKSGAHSIKLQTVDADNSYASDTESHKLFSKAVLTSNETKKMFDLSRSLNMEPFTTVGDVKTLEWVDKLSPTGYKISSGLLTHVPLIKEIAKKSRPILFSTGMASTEDIELSITEAKRAGAINIALFQCTSLYPTSNKDLNLASIDWMKHRYNVNVGFSDHSTGVDVSSYAVFAGACMIEKHFTLDSNRGGYDHNISLEPEEFREMVGLIKKAEIIRGTQEKELSESLIEQRRKYTRCLVAKCAIECGDVLSGSNLAIKRPMHGMRGLEPIYFESVLGKEINRSLNKDEPITENDIENIKE